MSHELLFVPGTEPRVASIIYTGKTPWHGFGIAHTSKKLKALEAVEEIGSAYEIVKVQNVCPHPDGVSEEFMFTSGYTLWRPPLSKYGLNEWDEFGQVSEDYVPISTAMVAALLDAKGDDGKAITDRWPVATHGIVSRGTRVFFSLDGGTFTVAGEDVQGYVNVRDVKTGKGTFDISVGGTVMVCRNTFDQAGSNRWVSADIRHVGDIEHEIRVRLAMIAEAQDAMNRMKDELNLMADTRLSDKDVKMLLEKTYPGKTPTRTFQLAKSLEASGKEEMFKKLYGVDLTAYLAQKADQEDNVMIYRAGVATAWDEYNGNDERKAHGTAWAFHNAVTGYVDHQMAVRGTDESRAVNRAFGKGNEAKSRAYAACVQLAKN